MGSLGDQRQEGLRAAPRGGRWAQGVPGDHAARGAPSLQSSNMQPPGLQGLEEGAAQRRVPACGWKGWGWRHTAQALGIGVGVEESSCGLLSQGPAHR